MADLRFTVDPARITVDTLILLEDVQQGDTQSARAQRDLLAGFLVGADGQALTPKEARALLGALTLEQFGEAYKQLAAALGEAKKSALPPGQPSS